MKIYCLLFVVTVFFGCGSSLDLTKSPSQDFVAKYEEFIKKNAPDEDAFVAVQRLAEKYIRERDWDAAVYILNTYKPLFKNMNERFDKIIDILKAKEEGLKIKNLGSSINTSSKEIMPVPTADELNLYFTSDQSGNGRERAFMSEFKDGKWQKAICLEGKLNRKNVSTVSISFNGNRLILLGDDDDSFGKGDIYYADRSASGWGDFQHFPKPINSEYYDSDGFIAADGKALLFTSDRPGGIGQFPEKGEPFHGGLWGNTDIYVCVLTSSGLSKPINLGPTINTPYAERTPFLHPDDKTLYFSSDGHSSLGRLDVFKSVRLNDSSWTEWSEPINLGKEINTAGNDFGYKISTSGELAYFSAITTDGLGKDDIYSITLPKLVKPKPVAIVSGKLITSNGNPLEADANFNDLSTGEIVAQLKSNPSNGVFSTALILGKKYKFTVEKSGYNSIVDTIDLSVDTSKFINFAKPFILSFILATISGNIIDANGKALEANIKFDDLSTGENIAQLKSNPDNGGFSLKLPIGKNYGFYAEKEGYFSASDTINLQKDITAVKKIVKPIVMNSIEEMKEKELSVRINNIFFDFNKYDLKPESYPELLRLAKILKKDLDAKVEISGHTDNIGSDDFNRKLSEKRAQAVVNYLSIFGCDKEKMNSKGYGRGKPVSTNETEEGRVLNRRVEFKFIKKGLD